VTALPMGPPLAILGIGVTPEVTHNTGVKCKPFSDMSLWNHEALDGIPPDSRRLHRPLQPPRWKGLFGGGGQFCTACPFTLRHCPYQSAM
jgi:hypothetical protein